jgi:TP901 family phage tail tape measure protein
MPSSASSVSIDLNVQLRGLVKLDKLNAALDQLRKTASGFQQNMGKNNAAFNAMNNMAATGAKNIAALSSANTKLNAQVSNLAKGTNTAAKSIRAKGVADRLAEAAALRHAKAIARQEEMQKSLSGRIRLYEEQVDAIFRAGFRLQMLGNDMERLGHQTIGALVGMANEFGDFEFMLNRAAGAMGILQDEVDNGINVYDRFQSAILRTSQELRLFKPEDVAKATYFWASTSGQQVDTLRDLEKALKAVNPLMRIAAMTETSYEAAIKGVYSILVQYGKGIEDVEDVVHKLNLTTVRTAAEFPDLINSFKMVGPVAAANNVTFEDMIDLFGKLADAGIRGSMSGRAFRQFFIQIVRPAPIAKAALEDLWKTVEQFGGKSYTEMVFPKGEFVGVTKYVNLLATAVRDMTQAERNALLARITTANELPVLTALVQREIETLNTGSDAWSKNAKETESAAQVFERQWGMLRNSWNGVVGAITRGAEIIRIQIGSRIASIFAPFLETITGGLEKISQWFDDTRNGPMIDFFVKLTAGIGVFLSAAGALAVFVGSLTSLGAAIFLAVRAFGPLVGQALALGGVISALSAAIIRNWDYVSRTLAEAGRNIVEAFGGAESGVHGLMDAFQAFFSATRPIMDFLVRTAADLINAFSRVLKTLMQFEPTAAILQLVFTVMSATFGARMIANVLGLTRVTGLFAAVVARLAIPTKILGGNLHTIGANATTSVGKVGKLTGAFKSLGGLARGLAGMVGPQGFFVLLTVGIGLAYDNLEGFRDLVDSFFKDFRGEAQAALQELGQWQDDVMASLQSDEAFRQLEANIDSVVAKAKEAQFELAGIKFRWGFLFGDTANVRQAENERDKYITETANMFSGMVDQLRNLGSEVSLDEFFSKAQSAARRFHVDLKDGARIAYTYYNAQVTGTEATISGIESIFKHLRGWAGADIFPTNVRKNDFLEWAFGGDEGVIQAKADERVQSIMAAYSKAAAGIGATGFPGAENINKVMTEQLMTQMLELRKDASPEIVEAINDLLNDSIAKGFLDDDFGQEAEEAATKTFGEIAQGIVAGAAGLKDVDKLITEAIKDQLKPEKLVDSLFSSEYLQTAFRTKGGDYSAAAKYAYLEQWNVATSSALADIKASSPERAARLRTIYTSDFNREMQKLPAKVDDLTLQTMENYLATIWGGLPNVPQEVLDQLWSHSVTAGQSVPTGVAAGATEPAKVQKVQDAMTALKRKSLFSLEFGKEAQTKGGNVISRFRTGIDGKRSTLNTSLDKVGSKVKSSLSGYVDNAYTWGSHLVSNFHAGIKERIAALLQTVTTIANSIFNILGHSTPKEGPLKNDDQWFVHLGDNLISGLEKSQAGVRRAATGLAAAAAVSLDPLSGDIGSNYSLETNRTIKIQIEVTSPDGSVDRLKAAQIEQGLQTSDLVLSLEHMIGVG